MAYRPLATAEVPLSIREHIHSGLEEQEESLLPAPEPTARRVPSRSR